MQTREKHGAETQGASRPRERPALSAEAMALMAKGHRLVLLALSSASSCHAGWPLAEHHTQSRVLAALAGPNDWAAETLDMNVWQKQATPSYQAMGRSPRKRSHPYLRRQKNTEFSPSIRAKRAGYADGVEALSVGLAYAAPDERDSESGQERRAARIRNGRAPKKAFRKIELRETRHEKRLESKAWTAFTRKRDARDKTFSNGDWNRLMLSAEGALQAFFTRVERVEPPTGCILEAWRAEHGLQAAVGYFASLRQADELRAAMKSAAEEAPDHEADHKGLASSGDAKGAAANKTMRL